MQTIVSPSPNHGGPRPGTVGVVIHSTRGGQAYGVEFDATLNWFATSASGVSAHAVVGRDGRVALVVPEDLIAWHARTYNSAWLGVELEQPAINDDFPPAQLEAAAELVREWADRYGIPVDRAHLRGHDEIPPGIADGKTDPGPRFPWEVFVALVEFGPPVPIPPEVPPEPPIEPVPQLSRAALLLGGLLLAGAAAALVNRQDSA